MQFLCYGMTADGDRHLQAGQGIDTERPPAFKLNISMNQAQARQHLPSPVLYLGTTGYEVYTSTGTATTPSLLGT